jgi:hypothetical protein
MGRYRQPTQPHQPSAKIAHRPFEVGSSLGVGALPPNPVWPPAWTRPDTSAFTSLATLAWCNLYSLSMKMGADDFQHYLGYTTRVTAAWGILIEGELAEMKRAIAPGRVG